MSFICVICRDLLKISEEEASPRHQQQLPNSQSTTNHVSPINNVSGRSKGKNNSIVATKCGHLFHYPCLSAWLSQSMNLTSDSKMRCPSCKQLIYIYELIQLFPVENGVECNKDLGHWFSTDFHQKLKSMLDHLDNLCNELNKKNSEISSPRPRKGNETPTRLQRARDSPKKSHTSQMTQLMKEMDSLRGSIKELNSVIEQHAEMGSVVEKQTKELSELRSKNEQLTLANERLKSAENEKEDSLDKTDGTVDHIIADVQKNEKKEDNETVRAEKIFTRTAQVDPKDDSIQGHSEDENACKISKSKEPSPSSNNCRRKSVTFLDPFEEFNDDVISTNAAIPFETKDFRVGDKVVWNFEGNQEIGTVKWKGFIGSQINVGVEFDRQLGIPIKDLSSDALQCIFKFQPGHGRVIPINELVLCNKEIMKKISHADDKYAGIAKASSNGLHKRIQQCSHQ